MKKTGFSVMLILLLLAGLVLVTGAAGDESTEVVISVARNGSYTIQEGDIVVLRAGWGACSPGLVRAYIAASNWEVTLDSEPLLAPHDVDALWGPVEIIENPPPAWEACVGVGRPARAEWRYVLPGLESGTYVLDTRWWTDHPLIDGGDYNGDGRPDLFTPEMHESVNTITVE